jgi:hypothetical protein
MVCNGGLSVQVVACAVAVVGLAHGSRRGSQARGRPALPLDLQRLITAMARANVTWGEDRIAAELQLKLGLRVSARFAVFR